MLFRANYLTLILLSHETLARDFDIIVVIVEKSTAVLRTKTFQFVQA